MMKRGRGRGRPFESKSASKAAKKRWQRERQSVVNAETTSGVTYPELLSSYGESNDQFDAAMLRMAKAASGLNQIDRFSVDEFLSVFHYVREGREAVEHWLRGLEEAWPSDERGF